MAKWKKINVLEEHIGRAEKALERGELVPALCAVYGTNTLPGKPLEIVDSNWSIEQSVIHGDLSRLDYFQTPKSKSGESVGDLQVRLSKVADGVRELADIYGERGNAGLIVTVDVEYSTHSIDTLSSHGFNAKPVGYAGIYVHTYSQLLIRQARQKLKERQSYIDGQVTNILNLDPFLVVSPLLDFTEDGTRPAEDIFNPEGIKLYQRINAQNPEVKFLGVGLGSEIEQAFWEKYNIPHVNLNNLNEAISQQLGVRMPSFAKG